ncbi:MAG: hypothetical protein JNK82_43895, partial [Myxococcaceae bacterium]|nr:hypothetical protein [Myxococcaceae bacterium]
MTLALLIALAAAPASVTVRLHWEERLKISAKGQAIDDDVLIDGRAKLKRDPASGVVTGELTNYPPFTAREDSGAPVVTFKEALGSLATTHVLTRVFGRLAVADPERAAMSSCTADTQAATERWLKTAVARLNGSEPSEVELTTLELKCTQVRKVTKLEVGFDVKVPRGTLLITMRQQKATLTVDPAVWFTQWKVAGPVQVAGEDVSVAGTF